MGMYELTTHLMEVSGMTFDVTYIFVMFVFMGCYGGIVFLLSFCSDAGRYLYRAAKKLLRFILRQLRRMVKL